MLHVFQLSFGYRLTSGEEVHVLKNMSFRAKQGSYTSIIGPSGCGKTTLLLCLSGLLEISEGKVILDGLSPEKARQYHKIGFVFQKPVFFEWMTILNNTQLPSNISGMSTSRERAYQYLQKFRIDEFANAYPHELSGGMLSRAALARALVHEPKYLFLDEAFNYLDETLREEINLDIQRLWIEKKMTIVAITHSISEALFMSDHILVMSSKPSTIMRTYEIPFERPRKPSLLKEKSFIDMAEEIRQALKEAHGENKSEKS